MSDSKVIAIVGVGPGLGASLARRFAREGFAVALLPTVEHARDKGSKNRVENSHQVTRQRARRMRRLKSAGHMQRFLAVRGPITNVFRVGRQLMKAKHDRFVPERAFRLRDELTYAQIPA